VAGDLFALLTQFFGVSKPCHAALVHIEYGELDARDDLAAENGTPTMTRKIQLILHLCKK